MVIPPPVALIRAIPRVPELLSPLSPSLTPDPTTSQYRGFRAPVNHGEALIDPPARRWDDLVNTNVAAAETILAGIGGDFWRTLRQDARTQLIDDARRYTSAYRNVPPESANRGASPIWMAGHQPTLFHPGVWFKNRMLAEAAESTGGLAISLVIDNDVASGSSIRVPVRGDSVDRPTRLVSVAMDAPAGGVPYEQWEVTDRELFTSFDRRVAEAIGPAVANPSVWQLWPHAREALHRCGVAGCALATARHRLEADLGWRTLECPLGVAVRGLPFARFMSRILADLDRFVEIYNAAAVRYRDAHGIRSAAHPVPDLRRRDGWTEVPLWVYGNASPAREPLWARSVAGGLELSDQKSRRILLNGAAGDGWAEQLADAAGPECKIRPRALVTTMYARTVLSDAFIHGIGGGKYDQVTDEIIRQFFGVAAPLIAVVSATIRLPGHRQPDHAGERVAGLQRDLRDTRFSGERFLPAGDPLAIDKAVLLRRRPTDGSSAVWHREMVSINDKIASRLDGQRDRLRQELIAAKADRAASSIWTGREHSFVLHPLDDLREQFDAMASMSPTD